MAQKTAMHQMLDELMAHQYTIPLELIVKCKELIELENEQIMKAHGNKTSRTIEQGCDVYVTKTAEQYYNETYNNGL